MNSDNSENCLLLLAMDIGSNRKNIRLSINCTNGDKNLRVQCNLSKIISRYPSIRCIQIIKRENLVKN
ncbi:hypothetical protein BpHYR1_054615 [Brachionus plicatilis]|uniref:Uncharacterized protein n=1 Tax=Brachionus plicatilis TaxID=10195 RepID=A0A3M7QZ51_BRAPC|nr:hypothetical protein BpHYR1_054615 [Brachionus plicatilis]